MTLRRLLFPLRLAWLRLARRGERVGLVALGIAAAAALLAAVSAGSLVARDRSLERQTAQLASADRAVRVVWGGIASGPSNRFESVDGSARAALRPFGGRPVRAMLFRQSQAQGRLFDLGAVDGLGRFVRLSSGRLPRTCRPERCEVVQLGGAGPIPRVPGLRLVRVGRASLDSAVPLGDLVTRETYAGVLSSSLRYHTAATPPLLLAEGVERLATVPAFEPTYRSYTWTLPLSPGRLHPWSLDRFTTDVTRERGRLTALTLAYDLTAPTDQLRESDRDGLVAGRRLLLIGGQAAALLLAFAVLAAVGLRRDAEAEWRRLTWYGARGWQLALLSVAETVVVSMIGAAIGGAIGAAVGAVVADRAGVPPGAVLAHSVVSVGGIALAVGLGVGAALVVLLSLRMASARLGAVALTPVDVAAIGAVVAVAVALARGAAGADTLAQERGTGVVLLVLPALIAFAAAVACARALAPALRLLERSGRSGPAPVRLAALSLARNPGRAAVAAAFLVVTLGLAVFAEAYRATLARGQSDEAAYEVPVDAIAKEDLTRLVPVLRAAPVHRFAGAVPGSHAFPVIRLSGDIGGSGTAFDLLGVPSGELASTRWRDDYSPESRAELARLLRPRGSVALRGVRLPADARRLGLPLRARGDTLAVRAFVVTPAGTARGLALGTTAQQRLEARVPPDARGGLLVSFTFDLTNTGLHGVPNGGANAAAVAQGTMRIGTPTVDGRQLPVDFAEWTGTGGITGTPPELRYLVTGDNVARFRARQPTDDRPVPVAATAAVSAAAGPGGVVALDLGAGRIVARIVAPLRRAPTVTGDVVLADEATAATALTADAPGSGAPDEVWVNAPKGAAQRLEAELSHPPFDALAVTFHRRVLADLRSEPLARGTLITLGAGAAAALVLALAGLLLGVMSDLRDERGELFDLEAQGAEPATLRRHLRLRAGLVALCGLVGGLVLGGLLTALIVALVTLTAGAGRAEPPLLLGADWTVLLLGLVAYAAIGAALVAVATRRAFRADVAGRFAEVGT
jgi:FtsX-like permease family